MRKTKSLDDDNPDFAMVEEKGDDGYTAIGQGVFLLLKPQIRYNQLLSIR